MSLKISEVGGYGTGALGEVTTLSGNINSYARVTAVSANTITILLQAASTGSYGGFAVGAEILFHVSGSTGTSYTTYLGKWGVAKITAVNGDVLTVDTNLTSVISLTTNNLMGVTRVDKEQLDNNKLDPTLTIATVDMTAAVAYAKTNNTPYLVDVTYDGDGQLSVDTTVLFRSCWADLVAFITPQKKLALWPLTDVSGMLDDGETGITNPITITVRASETATYNAASIIVPLDFGN